MLILQAEKPNFHPATLFLAANKMAKNTGQNRRNSKQNAVLLLFMQTHVHIATGDQKHSDDPEAWQELTRELNACGPPFRSTKEWRRTWSSCKHIIRKKLGKSTGLPSDSACSSYESKPLTAWEREINAILRKNSPATKNGGFIITKVASSAQGAVDYIINVENQESLHFDDDIADDDPDDCGTLTDEIQDFGTDFDPNGPIATDDQDEPTDAPSRMDYNNNDALNVIAGEIRSLNATTTTATDAILAMGSRICLLLEKDLEERQQHYALLAKLLDKKQP